MTEPTQSPAPRSRPAWLVAAGALVLTLVAGLALGWSLGRNDVGSGRGRSGGDDAARMERGREAFERRVGITPAQRTQIDSILGARRGQIDAFWKGPGQALRAILDSTQADVRAVLTPEQRVKYDEHRREEDARRAKRRGRYGGPPGGGMPMMPPPR